MLRRVKFIEKGKTMVASKFWGEENGELSFNSYRISVWENEKVLEMDDGDGCRTHGFNPQSRS